MGKKINMAIHHTKFIQIPFKSTVRIKEMGNVVDIMYSEKISHGGYITKLSKEEYKINRTGEVFAFRHNNARKDDIESIAKSLVRLRDYLNTNVTDATNCRWLTLTYAENMTNPQKLKNDFKNFNKRCREKYGHYEYIAAAEPQGRGAWHLHIVVIFSHRAPFMANKDIASCWKQGFVTVRKLDDIDNVGVYLTAYLGDMELSEYQSAYPNMPFGEVKEIVSGTEHKYFVKGARLSMYPSGFHLYRCSKGIKSPKISHDSYENAKRTLGDLEPTYRHSIFISDKDSGFENTISHEFYNRKQKKEVKQND